MPWSKDWFNVVVTVSKALGKCAPVDVAGAAEVEVREVSGADGEGSDAIGRDAPEEFHVNNDERCRVLSKHEERVIG